MITPEKREYLWLPETELNRIATEFYGRTYKAQQTGDMLSNDSYHVYDMSPDEVDQWNYDMEEIGEGHFLGLKRVPAGTGDRVHNDHVAVYAPGVNWFGYWLAIDIATDSMGVYPSGETTDLREFEGVSDMAAWRAAPTPWYVLADLIKNGVLPHGTYLMEVSW